MRKRPHLSRPKIAPTAHAVNPVSSCAYPDFGEATTGLPYPHAKSLTITADSGGTNSARAAVEARTAEAR